MLKKITLLAVVLFLQFKANGQISIEYNNLPSVGDAYATGMDSSSAFIDSLKIDSASVDSQYWDFSGLSNIYSDTSSYMDPASTKFGTDFPQAEMSTYINESAMYLYFKKDSTGLYGVGFNIDLTMYGLDKLSFYPDVPETMMGVPATYDSTWKSKTWYESIIGSGAFGDTLIVREVDKTQNIDAWGTIVTPLDTFNVIRMHEYAIENITLYFRDLLGNLYSLIPFIQDTANIYKFIAKEYTHPVLTINADTLNKVRYVEYINVDIVLPAANFIANPTLTLKNTDVQFLNLSSGAASYIWDFGDGTVSNNHQPVHAYSANGVYTVKLIASNANGTDSTTKTDYIIVTDSIIANFSYTATNLNVAFLDSSKNYPESWVWEFGDGIVSNNQNPTHNYAYPGTYVVKLTVSNVANSDSYADTITVSYPVGITDNNTSSTLLVFPNPSSKEVTFLIPYPSFEKGTLNIFNNMGQFVSSYYLSNIEPISKITTHNLNEGIYFYNLIGPNMGIYYSGKFIISH